MSNVDVKINTDTVFSTSEAFESGKKYIFVLKDTTSYGCACVPVYYIGGMSVNSLLSFSYVYGDYDYTGFVDLSNKKIYIRSKDGGTVTFTLVYIYKTVTL